MTCSASGLPNLLHYKVLRLSFVQSPLQQTTYAQTNGTVRVTVCSKTILRVKLIEDLESKGTTRGNGVEIWLVRVLSTFQGMRLGRLAACAK